MISFINTQAKSNDFIIAIRQIIQIKKISTVSISLTDDTIIKLHNVALALECNLNLISLGQLQENGIIYHNNPNIITLIKSNKTITYAKKSQNLITHDLAIFGQIISDISKVMAIIDRGWPIYFVSKNKHICF